MLCHFCTLPHLHSYLQQSLSASFTTLLQEGWHQDPAVRPTASYMNKRVSSMQKWVRIPLPTTTPGDTKNKSTFAFCQPSTLHFCTSPDRSPHCKYPFLVSPFLKQKPNQLHYSSQVCSKTHEHKEIPNVISPSLWISTLYALQFSSSPNGNHSTHTYYYTFPYSEVYKIFACRNVKPKYADLL